ncbi:Retinoblastoma-like protein 1 [Homalodisca vitripennis]|nr:Retinoblastoma-like protein 1 [Homalodisca vitripennis]
MFHQTLFACCLEIVIYSYNSQQRTFPWVLTALDIEPYHFYKIIEVTVRAEDQLSRDMVKHLNLIEEQILEALAWRGNSPLWEAIGASELPIPTCEDVSLPGQLLEDNPTLTPLNNPAIRRLVVPVVTQSPGPSASERFHSPVTSAIAKKKLFIENTGGVCTVKPGQSLLQAKLKPPVSSTGEELEPRKMSSVIINPALLKEKQSKPNRPRRTGSLGLFFRKVMWIASALSYLLSIVCIYIRHVPYRPEMNLQKRKLGTPDFPSCAELIQNNRNPRQELSEEEAHLVMMSLNPLCDVTNQRFCPTSVRCSIPTNFPSLLAHKTLATSSAPRL